MAESTIEEKLLYLDETKQLIKEAINDKGQEITAETPFRDYVEKINNLGTGDGSVKLFKTQEEMQADKSAKEGDLAIVYNSNISNCQADSEFQVVTFPETVVLPFALSDYVDVRFRSTDSSIMFDCWGNLDSNMFMMDCHTENGSIRIQYESSDGITYNRTVLSGEGVDGNNIDFGVAIKYEREEYWNDVIGYFIQVGSYKFDGLFEYNSIPNPATIAAYTFYGYTEENGERIPNKEDTEFTADEVNLFKDSIANAGLDGWRFTIFKDIDSGKLYVNTNNSPKILLKLDRIYITGLPSTVNDRYLDTLYEVDKVNKNLIKIDTSDAATTQIQADDCYFSCPLTNISKITISEVSYPAFTENSTIRYYANNQQYVDIKLPDRNNILKWLLAPNQFTLKASNELLPGKIGYGKNGEVVGNDSIWDDIPDNIIKDIFNINNIKNNSIVYSGRSQDLDSKKMYSLYKVSDYTGHTVQIGSCINDTKQCSIIPDEVLNYNIRRFTPYIEDNNYYYILYYDGNTSVYCERINKLSYTCDYHIFNVPKSWHDDSGYVDGMNSEPGTGFTIKDGKIYTGGYNALNDNYRVSIYELDPNTDTVNDISHTRISSTYSSGGGTYFRTKGSNIECFFCYTNSNKAYTIDKFIYDGSSTTMTSTTSVNPTPINTKAYTTKDERYVAYLSGNNFCVLDMDNSTISKLEDIERYGSFYETENYIYLETSFSPNKWFRFSKSTKEYSLVEDLDFHKYTKYITPDLSKFYYLDHDEHILYKINLENNTKEFLAYTYSIPSSYINDIGDNKISFGYQYLLDVKVIDNSIHYLYFNSYSYWNGKTAKAGLYDCTIFNVNYDNIDASRPADFILCKTLSDTYVLPLNQSLTELEYNKAVETADNILGE